MNYMIQNHAVLLYTSLRNEKRGETPQAPFWQPFGLKHIQEFQKGAHMEAEKYFLSLCLCLPRGRDNVVITLFWAHGSF